MTLAKGQQVDPRIHLILPEDADSHLQIKVLPRLHNFNIKLSQKEHST